MSMMVIVAVIFAWIVLGLATALAVGGFLRGVSRSEPDAEPEPEISDDVVQALALCRTKSRRRVKPGASLVQSPRALSASSTR